jgi:hypothetical protein
MNDRHFYRASPELAAALRAMAVERREYWDRVIKPYREEYPDNAPVWRGGITCVGFADGKPEEDPPEGLSRARTRAYLIPMRGRLGKPWRERMTEFAGLPNHERVLREFGVPTEVFGPGRLYFTSWMDLDRRSATPDGPNVVVYLGHPFEPVPAALTAMKRSEFYALHEAAMERVGKSEVT